MLTSKGNSNLKSCSISFRSYYLSFFGRCVALIETMLMLILHSYRAILWLTPMKIWTLKTCLWKCSVWYDGSFKVINIESSFNLDFVLDGLFT